MASHNTKSVSARSGLRERLIQQSSTRQRLDLAEAAQQTALELNAEEQKSGKDDREKRTFGWTPDGTGKSTMLLNYLAHPCPSGARAVYRSSGHSKTGGTVTRNAQNNADAEVCLQSLRFRRPTTWFHSFSPLHNRRTSRTP